MSYQPSVVINAQGNVIQFAPPTLPNFPLTSCQAVTTSDASLSVADNNGFSLNSLLLLGQVGQDGTEILQVSGVVTRGTSITVPNPKFNHPNGAPVQLVIWDQAEISGAATATGSKTVITTISIAYSSPQTEYVNTGTTYAFYFVRFKNSVTSAFSSYSQAAPAAGYASDTVRVIKNTALNMTGQQVNEVITDDFLNTEIVNCETELYVLGPGRRWAHFLVNNFSIGTLAASETKFAMPPDISDSDTAGAIQEIHTRQVTRLRLVEKSVVDTIRWDVALGTLAITANSGDVSITLTDVGDFSDQGTVQIGPLMLTYTARNTTTNVLSGIPVSGTGAITQTLNSGSNVWQGGQVDMTPSLFFVYPGEIELPLPPNANYWGQAMYCSYYSKPVYPTGDADTVNFPDVSVYHNFLKWKILLKLANGTADPTTEAAKQEYVDSKEKMMLRARLQDTPRFIPRTRNQRRAIDSALDPSIIYWRII